MTEEEPASRMRARQQGNANAWLRGLQVTNDGVPKFYEQEKNTVRDEHMKMTE